MLDRFLLQCYPSLEVKEAEICDNEGVSKWVIICSSYYARVEGRPVNPYMCGVRRQRTFLFLYLLNFPGRISTQRVQYYFIHLVAN